MEFDGGWWGFAVYNGNAGDGVDVDDHADAVADDGGGSVVVF